MLGCNTTLENLRVDNEEKYSFGLTFHEIGLILSAVFGLLAIVIAQFMMFQHALHYLRPEEQKHIIRILAMIPIYAAVSFLSYYYYEHSIYFDVLRDCYEAFAIASFFTLLCTYIAPNLHEQKDYFRTIETKNWVLPLNWLQYCTGGQNKGPLRKPRSGLTWFNIVWVCVFQYCFVRVFFTVVSVITQVLGRYCEDSLSPVFAHIWVMCFEGVSVCIAMYGLIQFYVQVREEIAEHRPFLKLLCIKLVIFFCFWQTLIISFLTSHGTLHSTSYVSYPDIAVGLPCMLLCLEMFIFAILHIFSFHWRPYTASGARSKAQRHKSSNSYEQGQDALQVPGAGYSGVPQYVGGFLGWRAFVDAFNPWDIIKASARGARWLFVGVRRRHDDASYQRAGADPLGMELKDTTNGTVGQMNGDFQPPVATLNVPTGYNGQFPPNASRGGYARPGDFRDGSYSREPSPYRNGPHLTPSWRPNTEDDDAWRPSTSGDQDSQRLSPDVEDQAALLRNAMRPGYDGRDIGA